MPKPKKAAATTEPPMARYTPHQKYVWIELVDPDAPDDEGVLQLKVRSDLSVEETLPLVIQSTEDKRPVEEMRDLVAPFVPDWNYYGADGEKVPPPAEAGGEQFKLLPSQAFWKVHTFLIQRGVGRFDVKRIAPTGSNPSTSTDDPVGATSSSATTSSATED